MSNFHARLSQERQDCPLSNSSLPEDFSSGKHSLEPMRWKEWKREQRNLTCCLNRWHWDPTLSGEYLPALWEESKAARAEWSLLVGRVRESTVPAEDSRLASGSENSPQEKNVSKKSPASRTSEGGYWHPSQGLYCPAPSVVARGPANVVLRASMASRDAAMAHAKSAGLLKYLEDEAGFSAQPWLPPELSCSFSVDIVNQSTKHSQRKKGSPISTVCSEKRPDVEGTCVVLYERGATCMFWIIQILVVCRELDLHTVICKPEPSDIQYFY